MTQPIAIILNARAGKLIAAPFVAQIKKEFSRHGVEPKIYLVHAGGDIALRTKQAIREGYQTIVAAGGDGTMSTVAGHLIGTTVVFGVLPMGTRNHFAKDLGIPRTLSAAVNIIVNGQTKAIDVGQVNKRYFLNNSSIGLYPKLVWHREQRQRLGHRKWIALSAALIMLYRHYPLLQVHLKSAEKQIKSNTPFVFIGNNEYALAGHRLGSRHTLDQHYLSILVAHESTQWGLLKLIWDALRNRLHEHTDVDTYHTKEIWIDTEKKYTSVALDGEIVVLTTPLHYRIAPAALQVLTPA